MKAAMAGSLQFPRIAQLAASVLGQDEKKGQKPRK